MNIMITKLTSRKQGYGQKSRSYWGLNERKRSINTRYVSIEMQLHQSPLLSAINILLTAKNARQFVQGLQTNINDAGLCFHLTCPQLKANGCNNTIQRQICHISCRFTGYLDHMRLQINESCRQWIQYSDADIQHSMLLFALQHRSVTSRHTT